MNEIVVIKTGGKQYKVKLGDELLVEKLDLEKDKSIEFVDLLANLKVKAKVIGHVKGPKIRILKFKAKTRYKRTAGHRQNLTKIKIEEIK